MIFDSHCHLNFKAFKEDADQVIKKTLNEDIWLLNVGSQYSTSQRAVKYAQNYSHGVYAAVGLHPLHLFEINVELENNQGFSSRKEEFDYEAYKKLSNSKKVVAIGETGLDYADIEKIGLNENLIKLKQKKVFKMHLALAKELNLPLIIHCRQAEEDLRELIGQNEETIKNCKGVFHCFMGSYEDASYYLNNGLLLSFNGLITHSDQWDNIIKEIPLEKILVETDSPYLAPNPLKGQRNEPVNIKYVVDKIARLKNVVFEEVAEITFRNAVELFRICLQ